MTEKEQTSLRAGTMARFAGLCLASLVLLGCSPAAWEGVAAGLAAAGGYQTQGVMAAGKILVFGGPRHQTYLGCLSCSQYDSDSIFNHYSRFGSQYSAESIFNKYGEFGSRYSAYSACNPYASDPPVIVDEAGNFYGRLTVNRYHPQRISNERIAAWITAVCGS
jgi:hypothetical protein